jgi:hypothetical protein
MHNLITYSSKKIFFLFVILFFIYGCSSSSPTKPTSRLDNTPIPSSTHKATILFTATPFPSMTPNPPEIATSIPESPTVTRGLTYQWTIKAGDLWYFTPLSNGKIYAIGESSTSGDGLYAILSKDGAVESTFNIAKSDIANCLRYNFRGGFTAKYINAWFSDDLDGTMYTFSMTGGFNPCVIKPGSPPVVERANTGRFFPFADGNRIRNYPDIPSGFSKIEYNRVHFWVDQTRNENAFYINKNSGHFGLVTRNAEFRTWALPTGSNADQTDFYVTPWDDVYYRYNAVDALGNNIGFKIGRTRPDSTLTEVSQWPSFFDDLGQSIIYLPWRGEFFALKYGGQSVILERYNSDFQVVGSYPIPPELNLSDFENAFIGYDLSFYVYKDKTLTKFLLIDPAFTSTTENAPTETSKKEKAIVIREYDTGKILFVDRLSSKVIQEFPGFEANMGLVLLNNGNFAIAGSGGWQELNTNGGLVSVHNYPTGHNYGYILGDGSFIVQDKCGGGEVLHINTSGAIDWSNKDLHCVQSVQLLDNQNIIIDDGSAAIYEIDTTGKIIWTGYASGIAWRAARLSNGFTLVGGAGFVELLDKSGKSIWKLSDFQDVKSVQQLPDGNLLVADLTGGKVSILSLEGKVIWEIENSNRPVAIYIPRNGQVAPSIAPQETQNTSILDLSQIPACPGAKPTRLKPEMQAKVSKVATQLALRDGPGMTTNKIHVIASGRKMSILSELPICADGGYWWHVYVDELGFGGWAREGDDKDYWIDPIP